jgi:hypothetical protein
MQPNPATPDTKSTEWIVRHYGLYLDTAKIAHLLGFGSAKAVRRAHKLDSLGFALVTLHGRRGLFASAEHISQYLNQIHPSNPINPSSTLSDH